MGTVIELSILLSKMLGSIAIIPQHDKETFSTHTVDSVPLLMCIEKRSLCTPAMALMETYCTLVRTVLGAWPLLDSCRTHKRPNDALLFSPLYMQ